MQVSSLLYKPVRTRSLGQRLRARRVVRGNEDDYWGILGLLYVSNGLQAIKVRHAIIHQHQFRLHGEGLPDCLAAVGRRADERKVALERQDLSEGLQH